jgi:D-ribose pyranase
MRKGSLLNSSIVSTLSKLGHTDQITIADAGLPIPNNVERIDIALIKNVPSFIETVKAVKADLIVEKVILAEEIKTDNVEVLNVLESLFKNATFEFVSHEVFKEKTTASKAVIRTGECTPYANIILQSGVDFSEA